MAASLHGLISSTVLLLGFLEALWGYRPDLPDSEKRIRILYAAGYGALIAVSVVWLRSVPDGSWADQSGDVVRMTCAILALGLSVLVWRYRRVNPLPKTKRRQRIVSSLSADDIALSERIRNRLEQGRLYLEPDLKVTDLAQSLAETEHKVRNCITGALGFRNFNHMVNHYRIAAAKEILGSDAERSRSILNVALDCGFSSIGPFNRAFKAETGSTPSAYRDSQKSRPDAVKA
ncbi:MAG: AraC family transcriptional regulator [Pseudomonadota bacterium]